MSGPGLVARVAWTSRWWGHTGEKKHTCQQMEILGGPESFTFVVFHLPEDLRAWDGLWVPSDPEKSEKEQSC